MNQRLARLTTAIGMVLASTAISLLNHTPSEAAAPQWCGFYELNPPQGEQTAGYVHCGRNFILIKYHWSQGSTGTACIEPWGRHGFFMHGPYRVVNAYYVNVAPNLQGPPHDFRCALSQPQV